MPKSLLILGGTGFIGIHVAKKAINEGYDTHILCRKVPSENKIIKQAKYIQCDLIKRENIKVLENHKFNYVINLSGDIIHDNFKNGGLSVIEVHLNALINLISILPRDNLLGFVQIGSSDEYGDSIAPQSEDQIEIPFSPYSLSLIHI